MGMCLLRVGVELRCGGGHLNLLSQLTSTGINLIFEVLRIGLLSPELYSSATSGFLRHIDVKHLFIYL